MILEPSLGQVFARSDAIADISNAIATGPCCRNGWPDKSRGAYLYLLKSPSGRFGPQIAGSPRVVKRSTEAAARASILSAPVPLMYAVTTHRICDQLV